MAYALTPTRELGQMVSVTQPWEDFFADDNTETYWAILRRMAAQIEAAAAEEDEELEGPIQWDMRQIPMEEDECE